MTEGTKMKTLGELFAELEKTENVEARIVLEEIKEISVEKAGNKYLAWKLTPNLVIRFAQDVASFFQEMINMAGNDASYLERIRSGHEFLLEIHKKAIALGVQVKLDQIDIFLTPTEMMVAAGFIKLVPADQQGFGQEDA